MQKTITAAAILLLLQIVLAVSLYQDNDKMAAFTPQSSFLGLDPQSITGLQITNAENVSLKLIKDGDKWIMPEASNAEADGKLVDELLTKLADQKKGFAVATSADAAGRFKVAADQFDRHLVLSSGDKVAADFYVGTAAGYRRSHARNSKDDDVVIIGLGSFEIEPTIDNWLDKNLIKRNKDEIAELTFPDFTLTREGDGWRIDHQEDGKAPTAKAVDDLLTSVCGIAVQSVLKPEDVSTLFQGELALSFRVKTIDGKETTYRFAKPENDESYYALKLSDRDLYLKIYSWLVQDLKKHTRQALLAPEATEAPKSEEAAKN